MLLHRYLDETFGNKVSIFLLRTMINYKGKIFTIRGLAKQAKVSPSETAIIIHDLEKLGIVKIQPVGKAYHLELNGKSYILNKVIEPALEAEKRTIPELLCLLKRHLDKPKIVSAVIFGSVVKSQEKIDSDIDILVISNDRDLAIDQVAKAGDEVFSIFHGNLSPLIFTKKEFKDKQKGSLIQSIADDHILICGKEMGSP